MGIETIEFNGNIYPAWQASGNAMRFAKPFAIEVCKGAGLDIGCKEYDWALPGAIPIDKDFDNPWEAMKLPKPPHGFATHWDFIFSSHCLEHLTSWVQALNYWHEMIKNGGVIFLYLPDFSQSYWRPWLKQKSPHHHVFTPEIMRAYFQDLPTMWKNVCVSAVDLNNSFIAIAEKV